MFVQFFSLHSSNYQHKCNTSKKYASGLMMVTAVDKSNNLFFIVLGIIEIERRVEGIFFF